MRLTIRTTSLLMLFLPLGACLDLYFPEQYREAAILEDYNAFMTSPNLPEICRAASRPSDTFNGRYYGLAKEAALRAVNDRNIQCDWSAEMKYWGDYALNQIQAQARVDAVEAEAAANYQAGGLLRAERAYAAGFLKCVYSNGTSIQRSIAGGGCPDSN